MRRRAPNPSESAGSTLKKTLPRCSTFPADGGGYSLVDVNRSGVPLMEVVSEPDMRSAEEARAYLMNLHSMLQYLGVTTGNMQDGSFRCDANISIRPKGSDEFGTRTEIKNMNSFRSVFQALNFEAERQRRVVEAGDRVVQETRGWVEERAVTVIATEQGRGPRLPLLPGTRPAPPGHRSRLGGRDTHPPAGACPATLRTVPGKITDFPNTMPACLPPPRRWRITSSGRWPLVLSQSKGANPMPNRQATGCSATCRDC